MNDLHDLTLILQSRFPLVVVETHEEPRVLALLEQAANLEDRALFVWSIAAATTASRSPKPTSSSMPCATSTRRRITAFTSCSTPILILPSRSMRA